MVKFEFYLSDEDTARLFEAKDLRGKSNLTGNEYAKELLEEMIYTIHPERVNYDEDEEPDFDEYDEEEEA